MPMATDDRADYLAHGYVGGKGFYANTPEALERERRAKAALDVYARELEPADRALAGVVGGQSSVALARQNAELGGVRGQMASMAVGGPMGARQAMFAGADQAHGVVGAASVARQDEIEKARRDALSARLRQMQYFAQLKAGMDAERFGAMRIKRGQDAAALESRLEAQQRHAQQVASALDTLGGVGSTAVNAMQKDEAAAKAGG